MLSLLLLVAGCQPEVLEPPRLVTQTSQALSAPTNTPLPLISEAPTPTRDAPSIQSVAESQGGESNQTITLWVNETSKAHETALNEMAASFAQDSGIHLEVVLVTPSLLPELVQTAVLSDTLPDLILHSIEFSHGWVEEGILEPQAATAALELLGRETFDADSLDLLATGQDGNLVAALPSDGWQQLIVYRSDWFDEIGLEPPTSFETLMTAAETIYQPEGLVTGLVVPTDASLVTTQQVFEHLATANGCPLVDEQGKIQMLHPACLEALEFYRTLVNGFSPIGFQTDTSAVNAYLSGRTGIIVSSPSILPILAGLEEDLQPDCPSCSVSNFLAENSGFITDFQGGGDFSSVANFGEIKALGITNSADQDLAAPFVDFWFNQGYPLWLGIDPERKVPMRLGTPEEPTLFIDNWGDIPVQLDSPGLEDLYDSTLVEQLQTGIATSARWGFQEGQGALITRIYEELILAPLLQEMLSGYFTSSQTIVEMYQAVIDSIPDYSFPVEVIPTPTPS